MNSRVRTCLWFENDARKAVEFYVSLLPNSAIEKMSVFEHALGAEYGDVEVIDFTLDGAPYRAMGAEKHHAFNDAMSIVIVTEDQDETDRLWNALTTDGGEPVQCGWLKDRFGVSWQIVPRRMMQLVGNSDRAAARRAMQAMLDMQKLDIASLERAFAGTD